MRFQSIRSKLLFYICTLVIAGTVILQATNSLMINSTFNTLVPNSMNAVLNNAQDNFKANIDEDFAALTAISLMPGIRDTAAPLVERALSLQYFIEKFGEKGYQACAITDVSGKAVLSSGFEINVSQDEYFKKALQGEKVISDPFVSVATGKLIVVYAVPYYDMAGNLAGVITLDVDALHLSNRLSEVQLGESGIVFVIDSKGVTVASNDTQTVIDRYSDFKTVKEEPELSGIVELEKKMVAGESGHGFYQYDGREEIMCYMPVPGTDWSIGVTQTKAEAYGVLNRILFVGIGILLVVAILSALSSLWLSRTISAPIVKLAEAAADLAAGDTEKAIHLKQESRDEIGKLTETFVRMSQSIKEQERILIRVADGDLSMRLEARGQKDELSFAIQNMLSGNNALLSEVAQVGEQVRTGANQISQGSRHLAHANTEQTMAVENISRAIWDMEGQIKGNLTLAENAGGLSKEAESVLRQSGENMLSMTEAMEEIKTASDSIANVIKMIDNIAFQTNILALNAAVEAARAGQHGKGFAVVADEVRSLAARSAEAARDTTALIQNSVQKVGEGTRIAYETGASMNKVTEISKQIIELVGEIERASKKQAEAISRINTGIEQVNRTSQSNAAEAEESASSSQELLGLATKLRELMKQYRLA